MNDSIETSEGEARKPVTDAELPTRGPRVAPDAIEAEIASEHYGTAFDLALCSAEAAGQREPHIPQQLHLLTLCVLVLRNGYTVTGEAACVSAVNFDARIGKRIAREAAVRKIGPLLGFRLHDQLAG